MEKQRDRPIRGTRLVETGELGFEPRLMESESIVLAVTPFPKEAVSNWLWAGCHGHAGVAGHAQFDLKRHAHANVSMAPKRVNHSAYGTLAAAEGQARRGAAG